MAATQNARDLALAATSPRIVPVALPTNTSVDLSNTSQAVNNLPSYLRVSGITAISTQSALDLAGSYIIGNLSAARISAGTLSAGVIYGGSITANQITSGTASYDTNQVVFGLGVAYAPYAHIAGVSGRAYGASKLGGAFTQYNTNGYALAAAAAGGTGGAGIFLGGWNSILNTNTTSARIGAETLAGEFFHVASGFKAQLATASYAADFTGHVRVSGAFGCNGKNAQVAIAVDPAVSGTDLMATSALVNDLRYVLIQFGFAV